MKLALFLIFLFAFAVCSQELPTNFTYKNEQGQNGRVIQMMPMPEALDYDAAMGKAFRALGIIVQPEMNIYGLVFVNGQKDFEFDKQKDDFITLKLDNETLKINEISRTEQKKVKNLTFEFLTIKISKQDFDKIADSTNILFAFGDIKYQLDQNNLQSFKYTKSKIANLDNPEPPKKPVYTSTPNSTPSRTYYRGPRGGCYYLSGKSKVYVDKSYCS